MSENSESQVDRSIYCSLFGLRNKRAPFVTVINDEEHVFEGMLVHTEKAKNLMKDRQALSVETDSLSEEQDTILNRLKSAKSLEDKSDADVARMKQISDRMDEIGNERGDIAVKLFVELVPGYYPDATRKLPPLNGDGTRPPTPPVTPKMLEKQEPMTEAIVKDLFEYDWNYVNSIQNDRLRAERPKIMTSNS